MIKIITFYGYLRLKTTITYWSKRLFLLVDTKLLVVISWQTQKKMGKITSVMVIACDLK